MKDRILNLIFSLSGASVAIGVVGFMSGIVSIFIDVNSLVSIKWLLLIILLTASLILILLKVVYDLSQFTIPPSPFETPIKYVADEQVFVIKRNENFLNHIVVGCYIQQDEIDRVAYLGVVHLVQDKVIQIKVRTDFQILPKIPETTDELSRLVIRPVVPVSALEQFNNLENQ